MLNIQYNKKHSHSICYNTNSPPNRLLQVNKISFPLRFTSKNRITIQSGSFEKETCTIENN